MVQSLPAEAAGEMCNSIREISVWNSFGIPKDTLNKHLELSIQQRFDTPFKNLKIGNRKPSQLFRCMWQLLGSHKTGNPLLRHSWMQKLPSVAREVLTSYEEHVLTAELAETVDRMFDANPKRMIAVTAIITTSAEFILRFKKQINHLTLQMNVLLKGASRTVRVRICYGPFTPYMV